MLGKTHGVRAPTGLAKVMESAVGRISAQEPRPQGERPFSPRTPVKGRAGKERRPRKGPAQPGAARSSACPRRTIHPSSLV